MVSLGLLSSQAALSATAVSPQIEIQIPIIVPPACSVANVNGPNIQAPTAIGPGMTLAAWKSGATTLDGDPALFTFSSILQQLRITCNYANTPITSLTIKAGASATMVPNTGVQYIVDSTGKKAFGGLALVAHLTKVGTTGLVHAFQQGAGNVAYTGAMTTGALNSGASVANFEWRPVIHAPLPDNTAIGAPTGGSFYGTFEVVVDY
ncbi:hypothetical protein FSC37_22350 [Piscinibacter aquaticus]|uniref:DUF4402 domain-containing protein n=1 Tax=Piscinibacter aquaticus TaxID=392597 RepID=A0A5C6TN08_9BURK|nr:hypothetical protein FSC37_22350 [Piscinibacter aquaticus]